VTVQARRVDAQRRIDEFGRRIRAISAVLGVAQPDRTADSAIHLASHAALAVAIDAQFLHLLRVNFFLDKDPLPYWIEARLLVSPLCRDQGDGLYTIDAGVRDLLLTRLATDYGPGRLKQVANLLWQYTDYQQSWADRRELRYAQQLTAISFLDSKHANDWLQQAEQGAGDNALPKEWFVAIRRDLFELPPVPDAPGDPDAEFKALSQLDFEAQVGAFRGWLDKGRIGAFLLQGPPHHAQAWLLYRLARELDPVQVYEITLEASMSDYRVFNRVLADAVGVTDTASWMPAIDRLVELTRTYHVVLAFHHVERVDLMLMILSDLYFGTLRSRMESSTHRGEAKSLLLVLVDYGPMGTDGEVGGPTPGSRRIPEGYRSRVFPLPPISRISETSLRSWFVSHGSPPGGDILTSHGDVVASVLGATGNGIPQQVLEQLCLRRGVRWPDVLARARRAVVPAGEVLPPMVKLARDYVDTRARMPPSSARTNSMEAIVAEMRALVASQPTWPLETYTNSASAGERLAAVAVLQERPDPRYLEWLGARTTTERPFLQYHALLALHHAVDRLPAGELGRIATALDEARKGLGDLNEATDRAFVLREAEKTLAARRRGALRSMRVLRSPNLALLPNTRSLVDLSSLKGGIEEIGDEALIVWTGESMSLDEPMEKRIATIARKLLAERPHRAIVAWEGIARGRIVTTHVEENGVLVASVEPLHDSPVTPASKQSLLLKRLRNAVAGLAKLEALSTDEAARLREFEDAASLGYNLANSLALTALHRQRMLDISNLSVRTQNLLLLVSSRIEAQLPRIVKASDRFQEEFEEALVATYSMSGLGDLARAVLDPIEEAVVAGNHPRTIANGIVLAADTQGRLSTLLARAVIEAPGDNDRMLRLARDIQTRARPQRRSMRKGAKSARALPRIWPNGSTLHIKFMGGYKSLHDAIMKIAGEWTQYANLRFEAIPVRSRTPADIRIGFNPDEGSWSYVGTDARGIPPRLPTMNLGSLIGRSLDDEARRFILKEFGHSLGLINEHQNPNAKIPWDRDAVLRELGAPPNSWSRETVENQIFRLEKGLEYRPFDSTSVMMLHVPASWTTNGQALSPGSVLSDGDRRFISQLYPRGASAPVTAKRSTARKAGTRPPKAKTTKSRAARRLRRKK